MTTEQLVWVLTGVIVALSGGALAGLVAHRRHRTRPPRVRVTATTPALARQQEPDDDQPEFGDPRHITGPANPNGVFD